jgi:prolyl-tRNA editing enzyme YbaK/EbsC (Cys-tRNA(Pro) deacylase)
MSDSGESGSERVQRLIREAMGEPTIVHLAASARTAAEAAAAIGCTVAQIAKSLIFKGKTSGEHILVIASGAHRVDEARVAAAIGEPLGKADADFVRERTGYAIGAVAPIGHLRPPRHVLVDSDLANIDPLWAAAGHTHIVFRLSYADLLRLTGGRICEIA